MTSSRTDLHLHEQLLLLALRDDRGTPESGSSFQHYALGGAILAELALGGRIHIEEGRKALVEGVPGGDRLRDAVLAEALGLVRSRKRRQRAVRWVPVFAAIKDLRHRTALGLCRRGILRKSEARVLLIFNRRTYPTLDPGPERDLLARMRDAISGDGDVEAGLGVVIGVAHATGLLKVHYERKLLSRRKHRLERIGEGKHLVVEAGEPGDAGGASQSANASVHAATASVRAATAAAQAAVVAAGVAASAASFPRT